MSNEVETNNMVEQALVHPSTVATPSTPQRITIEVGGVNSKSYKSIDYILWEDIPPFVVLTGLNGAGKTQFLELLAYKLTGTNHPELGDLSSICIKITGDKFEPDSVAYIPSKWELPGAPVLGIAQMQQVKQQLYNEFQQSYHHQQSNIKLRTKRAKFERILGVNSFNGLDFETFGKKLPDDFAFMLDEEESTSGLTHVFLAHRLRIAEALENGIPHVEIPNVLGPAPWDVVNETFQAAEFAYRVVSPRKTKLLDQYELPLEDPINGKRVRPTDLSSGEKTLLSLVVWLYNSQHHGRFPRLFLLDEPDAHLHPSMTRHLLNVIKDVLVDRYNVRVILTTHSPSTVALAPQSSVFEMSKIQPRIVPSKSQVATVGLLTAGLITVSPSTRFVLVEDEDDVKFYSAVRDILIDYGPSRDLCSIPPEPSIIFLPASNGVGKGKIGGGSSIVIPWVDKFDSPPLNNFVRGIIDRDVSNVNTSRIYTLNRYSIENYLLDPLIVYGVLLGMGKAPVIANMAISAGDEHRIRSLRNDDLQAILNSIRNLVESAFLQSTSSNFTIKSVEFTNGRQINYPTWMLDHRGHDLLPLYQSCFGGPSVITPPRLEQSFRRVRMLPVELARIMNSVQS